LGGRRELALKTDCSHWPSTSKGRVGPKRKLRGTTLRAAAKRSLLIRSGAFGHPEPAPVCPGTERNGVRSSVLIAHCREYLASYKVPRLVQFVESVPMTPSGEIMRRMLKNVDDGKRADD
jgi:hypothetical protein